MKGTIVITMFGIIIFLIASFFIFFSFDKLVSNEMICMLQERGCEGRMSNTFTFGFVIILALIIMIISAAYVMVRNISIDIEYRKKRK